MSDRYTQHAREKLARFDPNDYIDDHHLMFNALEWNTRPAGMYIRQNIIARGMSRAVHNVLHKNLSAVPVPNIHSLQRVANELTPGQPVLQAVDEYCLLLDRETKHPKIRPIEIRLNELSVSALRAQIPYVKDGIRRRT